MSEIYKGSCLCGAVQYVYRPSREPIATVVCHCLDCQRYTGTAFGTYILIPSDDFSQTGEVRSFETEVAPGRINQRNFCVTCGSHMAEYGPAFPGITILPVGTLDDASWIKPAAQCFAGRTQPWAYLNDDIRKFDALPPIVER
ncbi:MAG: GFA family protein [Chromatiales bacterium]|nr:MAG: GFA family protein [Chromatiales bacterium]